MRSYQRTGARRALLASTAAFGLAIGTGITAAQAQTQTQTAEDSVEVEEIVVTGSRIKRAGFDTLQPAVNLGSEFIDDRGFANVADALNEVPAFGIPVSNTGGQSGQNLGQNFANAFGLGSQRTLTLINGRRTVGQNTPTSVGTAAGGGLQVDLNIIPTALIDRVETVFIGGAPIYGTDAIAGTVNIILKEDFEGFVVDALYGIDLRGDQEDFRIRGAWGINSGDGRGNIMATLEYVTNGGVRTDENDIVRRSSAFCEAPGSGFTFTLAADCNNLFTTPNTGLPVLLSDPTVVTTALFTNDLARALKDGDGNPLIFDTMGNLITFEQANIGTPLGNTTRSIGGNGFVNPIPFFGGEMSIS